MPQHDARMIFDAVVEMRGVEGIFEISSDGFLLHSLQSRSSDPEAIAAVIAATIRSWKKIGRDINLGKLCWVMLEYQKGRMIVANYGNTMIVIIGSLHMVCGEVLATVQPLLSALEESVTVK